ncbi:hypothetical protein G1H11_03020 [Phytoactinopolyspora alkaliphila]|uniref:Uncharacterized protein n=1 Tax=Phytoactinopolyspora alkaliphila TaxID=1783498 RepID=A0A6N9YGZ9_9ACTN|nr:hypothetical protein [Phytoactinopolyspora alkaliphila]NED94276.1 hypothetical protein [Phytoactinopolyspora alkaliphila]
MLRRDTEYVLTWNARNHSWLVRPIERDGNQIVQIGPGSSDLVDPAWSLGADLDD